MNIDHHLELGKAISKIESLAIVMPSVGKRSELKVMQQEVMQQEMYQLITTVRVSYRCAGKRTDQPEILVPCLEV
jgi:hypothetical protein